MARQRGPARRHAASRRACRTLAVLLGLLAGSHAAALDGLTAFGPNPGELDAFLHVPAGAAAGLPVVVALHGCEQAADGFDGETGLTALADATPFILLLPQQRAANNELRCFNWFRTDDNRPGRGESASIRNMLDTVVSRYQADRDRAYVMGLSAGGSMTAVLLANYPDRFAAGAVVAGTPYDCNRSHGFNWFYWWWTNTVFGDAASATLACGLFGYTTTDRSPASWGEYVRDAATESPDSWPRVSLWQGTADEAVDPANLGELLEQWADVHGIDTTPETTETVAGARRAVFEDVNGNTRIETWRIEGFPHALPVDPDATPRACGVATGRIRDADVCAVRRITAFWGLGN